MRGSRFGRGFVLVSAAALALTLGGCGGGDEGAVIEFPEGAANPTLTKSQPVGGASSTTSQGDPSQYTR